MDEELEELRPWPAQVLGMQVVQTFALQVSLVWQVPQVSFLPQPSSMVPQFLPAEAQVLGVQVVERVLCWKRSVWAQFAPRSGAHVGV